MVSVYDDHMGKIIDRFAPVIKKRVPLRVRQPWFNSTLRNMKIEKRKLERVWRRTGVRDDYINFRNKRNDMNVSMRRFKEEYFRNLVEENRGDQKQLFRIFQNILHQKKDIPYPDTYDTPLKLANAFNSYFIDKIDKITSLFCDGADFFR